MLLWKVVRHLLAIAGIVVLGGLISATLVRMAPGFETDEHQLDPGLSTESIRAFRASHEREHNILRYYAAYLREIGATLILPIRETSTQRILGMLNLHKRIGDRFRDDEARLASGFAAVASSVVTAVRRADEKKGEDAVP